MLDWRLLCQRRKKLFKLSLMSSRTLPATRHSPFLLKSLKSLCSCSVDFTEVPDDEITLTFLINLGYKVPLYKHPSIYVDHMHQPWRTLAAIINKCLSGKAASNDRLRKSRIDILWGMFYRENVNYGKTLHSRSTTGSSRKADVKTCVTSGKGSQGKKTVDTPKAVVNVFEEFDSEPARKRTDSRRVKKKKVSISADDNIIPKPDVALELGKSISLTEAVK
ncbi:hypothetical protein Tco_1376985 [Tanacetum coccineum]